jgi:hypothetical protein
VGKWALNPQTRINTGFFVAKSTFKSGQKAHLFGQKWAKSSVHSSKIHPIFHKIQKAHFAKFKSGRKFSPFSSFLKVYGRIKIKERALVRTQFLLPLLNLDLIFSLIVFRLHKTMLPPIRTA